MIIFKSLRNISLFNLIYGFFEEHPELFRVSVILVGFILIINPFRSNDIPSLQCNGDVINGEFKKYYAPHGARNHFYRIQVNNIYGKEDIFHFAYSRYDAQEIKAFLGRIKTGQRIEVEYCLWGKDKTIDSVYSNSIKIFSRD